MKDGWKYFMYLTERFTIEMTSEAEPSSFPVTGKYW
jgi:hypothetical protein